MLPYLDIEYPFRHELLHCQDNIIEKYFHHSGQLREDFSYSKKASAYIANLVEDWHGSQRRNAVLNPAGLAYSFDIGNDRTTRSGFKNFTMGANRKFKSIFLGHIWENTKKNRYNRDFLELIKHCEDCNFTRARQILDRYNSDLMSRIYYENYQPFQEVQSAAKKANQNFINNLSQASNDLEASEVILNNINNLSGKNIDPRSIDLALQTIKTASGTEVSNEISEILNNTSYLRPPTIQIALLRPLHLKQKIFRER